MEDGDGPSLQELGIMELCSGKSVQFRVSGEIRHHCFTFSWSRRSLLLLNESQSKLAKHIVFVIRDRGRSRHSIGHN